MRYRAWCRMGEWPLHSTDEFEAIKEAVRIAVHNGMYVILLDEDRNEVAYVPPAPQTDMIPSLLFDGTGPEPGIVARN